MKSIILIITIITTLFFSSCSKDKLTGEYNMFEGRYTWVSTATYKNAWTHSTIYQGNLSYTAEIELDNEGQILFYKDSVLTYTHTYQILDREINSGNGLLLIKLNNLNPALNIHEAKLELRTSGDTTLTVSRYPFPAIDLASNYSSGYNSGNNNYRRN